MSRSADCVVHTAPAHSTAGRVTVGEIARRFGTLVGAAVVLLPAQVKALIALACCRTAALGGHLQKCTECQHETPMYNSCRNRHCPACQSLDQARWLEARRERILPTPYFHVVFTLPAQLRAIARDNSALVYALLFRAASETLLAMGADPRHLGALPAITAVLHTWSRDLSYHVHLHCIVSAGGLSPDGSRWIRPRNPKYLFPARALGALFRGKLLDALRRAHLAGTLHIPPDSRPVDRLLDRLHRIRWLVYAKAPFAGAEHIYAYLGRYTHRVGISNSRLESIDKDGNVTFRTKDGNRTTLHAVQFLQRFLQHVLPRGFVKIRHTGLLAPTHVGTRFERARKLLADAAPHQTSRMQPVTPSPASWVELLLALAAIDITRCPRCDAHAVVRVPIPDPEPPPRRDTS